MGSIYKTGTTGMDKTGIRKEYSHSNLQRKENLDILIKEWIPQEKNMKEKIWLHASKGVNEQETKEHEANKGNIFGRSNPTSG